MTSPVAPLCSCHGEPCYWHKDARKELGGYWRCRERRKPLDAARWEAYYYERMPASIRIPRSLQSRRLAALRSRRERHERMEA